MPRSAVQRERDVDTERVGMPLLRSVILSEQGGRYQGRAMPMPRENDADAEGEQCRSQMLPGNEAYNSTIIGVTG
jgi:hypothetical protein